MTARTVPQLRSVSALSVARHVRRDPVAFMQRIVDEVGHIGGFRLGPQKAVLVNEPEAVGEVLVGKQSDFGKGRIQLRALRPLMGNGLLTSEGELHQRQRRLAAPAFAARRTSAYVDTISAMTEELASRWLSAGDERELLTDLSSFKLDLVGQLLLGMRLGDDQRLVDSVTDALTWELRTITRVFPTPLAVPTPANLRMRRALRYIHGRLDEVIAQSRARQTDTGDVLSMLLSTRDGDGTGMSDRQLRDEVLTLTFTAEETPTNALTWTLYQLMRHPDVYRHLCAEADAVLGDGPVTAENVGQLHYALAVYKESMRLIPPAPIMMRTAVRDTTVGGYQVSAGTVVLVSPYTLHRRPDFFADPERFDPDRFMTDLDLPRHAYLPFGAGRHVCIGNHLALLEGQVILATLARRLRLELVPGQRINAVYMINLRPEEGIRVTAHARETNSEEGMSWVR